MILPSCLGVSTEFTLKMASRMKSLLMSETLLPMSKLLIIYISLNKDFEKQKATGKKGGKKEGKKDPRQLKLRKAKKQHIQRSLNLLPILPRKQGRTKSAISNSDSPVIYADGPGGVEEYNLLQREHCQLFPAPDQICRW